MTKATSAQFRAARAILGLTVRELAKAAGVHRNTIVRIESGEASHGPTMAAVQRALEAAGIMFLPAQDGSHGPAVALKWGQPEPRPSLKSRTEEGEANEDGGHQAADPDLADFMTSAVWLQISEDGRETIAQAAFGED